MVLSFALCASFAFAQSNNVTVNKASAKVGDMARQANTEVLASEAGYTGSIFTKDGTTHYSCTFAASDYNTKYTTGVVGYNEMVNGTAIPRHTNNGDYSRWTRGTGSSYFSSSDFSSTFPVLSQYFGNFIARNFTPESLDDGFMLCSMIDNYAGWGGDGDLGYVDSYILFQGIDLSTCDLPQFNVYQMYRAFNQDHTYIDYSIDNGTTWYSYEINIHGVDISTNGTIRGKKRVTIPRVMAHQSNVLMRLRYVDESSNSNGGYFYVVDDVTIEDAPENHLRFTSNQYFEGFYQMMPQGLQLPVVWAADFYNDGNLAQTNAKGGIYTYADGEEGTLLVEKSLNSVVGNADSNRTFVIDPLGIYDSASEYHGYTYDPDSSYKTGAYACLPTAEIGANFFYSDVTTDFYEAQSFGFDTLRYNVNYGTITDATGQQQPAGIWGRDHGVLTYNGDGSDGSGNHYTPGRVITTTDNVWSDDYTETSWNKAGYGNFVAYMTGNTVPNGWRILGMEMVASTTPGMSGYSNNRGANIIPILWYDSLDDQGRLNFLSPQEGTGVNTYTIKQNDVNNPSNLTYRTTAQGYNTIRILFPTQPALEANTVYRLGYVLNEDADFAVAQARTSFVRADTTVYFEDEPNLVTYKNILHKQSGNGNYYSVFTRDMRGGTATILGFNTSNYPMIRMIVGPSYDIASFDVSWECDNEDFGTFISDNNEVLCGTTESVFAGSSFSFYAYPEYGYEIDRITINDIETDYRVYTDEDGIEYGLINVENVTENMVFKCYFKLKPEGFDPIASRVAMKLQPNPATSNVFVSLKGVTGNVNMALLDMSGRVVTTSEFNAENGANINVSNLAKGAYFVRITNNNFTKIEKLIVR